MKVALVGFMGTGKTCIGRVLARELNFDFVDIDKIIENKTDISISKIFALHGEEYFRTLESEVLRQIVEEDRDLVIATGGGIVLKENNIKLLKKQTFPVLLQASSVVINERIDGSQRPLLQYSDPITKIENLMSKRKPYYNQFQIRVNTDYKNPNEIVSEILSLLEGIKNDNNV